ncbi:hypothetical protein GCM10011297_19620 [Bacterioplanes sanyensis]|uniref:type II secretion system F family protein n=1 Tax=Bacterioplanes sanyensis TaxID=1249553 RepID=UPI00167A6E9D|nr:type II secretion system F family protein [Bacterioplanes sanyensis]GGY46819.1 hypothetical protein GCM10011297_19620 [Bacterioplanes sanyensis]
MTLATTLLALGLALSALAAVQQGWRQRWLRRLRPLNSSRSAKPWWLPLPAAMQRHAQVAALTQPWLGTAFWSAKAILAVLAAWLLWPQTSQVSEYSLAIVAAVIGQMLPDVVLRQRAQKTLRDSRAQLPELMQLLALCLEAGLTLDQALPRLAREIKALQPALASHLQHLNDDLRVMSARRLAFARLAERIPLEDFRQLSWLISQADDYGTPLAAGLRELGQHSRSLYLLEVEERMARVPGQMALPLMLFIILPLVVVLAGPALVMLLRQLGGGA